jgi:hypothetical protein
VSERIPLEEMGKHWIHAGVFPEPGPWPTDEYRDQLTIVGRRMLAGAERGARAWEPEEER